jgi:hypothetical protein
MSDQETTIACDVHGKSYATFVCQHLLDGIHRGFYCSNEGDDPRPDAWCRKCDELFLANGGEWNEEAEKFADIKLLCVHCYDNAKANNLIYRPNTDNEGWELCIIAEHMNDYPDIIPPSAEALLNLKAGDLVKLIFEVLGEDGDGEFTQCERMWVSIKEKTRQGYKGTLDNEPTTEGSLHYGEPVEFEDQHIMEIYKAKKTTDKYGPSTRLIEKRKVQ